MVNGSNGGHTKWNYDTALNGIGAVHEILSHLSDVNDDTTAIHKVEYGYDNKSRLDARTTSFNGLDYTEGFSYNASNGFLASRQYPSSGDTSAYPFEVKYNYTNGYLQSITSDTESAGQCVEHYSINEYDAQGRVTEETLGRLVNTHRSFKGGKGVLEGIQSTLILGAQTGVMVQDLSYIYDAVNNVDSRTDNNTGIYERFEYDDLHRLTKFFKTDPDPNVNGGSEALITQVDYDEIGNITRKSDVGTYQYETNGNLPHAVKRVVSPFPTSAELTKFDVSWEWNDELKSASAPGADIRDQDFTYDLNGNILKSGNREFGWTSFDKPERMVRGNITSGYTGATFLYDGQFNRIQKQEATFNALQNIGVPKETTFYIGKDYEKISNANETEILHRYSINVGGSVIQVEREHNTDFDQPKYLLADNLGSTNVIVDQLGADVQTLSFDPWGMRVNSDGGTVNGITNRGFTGHEMDDEVGLVNMNARIYDPYLGRFLSADPVLQDPSNMQSFNRYSYVWNNPLRYSDPSGNQVQITGDCGWLCTEPEPPGGYPGGPGVSPCNVWQCPVVAPGLEDSRGPGDNTGGGGKEGNRGPNLDDCATIGCGLGAGLEDFPSANAHVDPGCATGCPAHPSGNPNGPSNNGAGHRACVASGECPIPPRLRNDSENASESGGVVGAESTTGTTAGVIGDAKILAAAASVAAALPSGTYGFTTVSYQPRIYRYNLYNRYIGNQFLNTIKLTTANLKYLGRFGTAVGVGAALSEASLSRPGSVLQVGLAAAGIFGAIPGVIGLGAGQYLEWANNRVNNRRSLILNGRNALIRSNGGPFSPKRTESPVRIIGRSRSGE